MPRYQGRTIFAANLAERRVLKGMGLDVLRIPRKLNPFAVGRKLARIAAGRGDLPELKAMLAKARVKARDMPVQPVVPSLPDSTSEPREAVAA